MRLFGLIAYGVCGLLFLVFVANLVLARGGAPLFGTSSEALTLLIAAGLFGVGTLVSELQSRN
ncbi:hypothetical protein [Paracoccus lutimaris]|uniref:Uncharacterized protein n=1 Tax=Paracoccus lutimaris TaxID=1490030 RepID=A0A368YV39_9RHOB|nr:hypothetical protein [Paracoccus lutimaris]RCW82807.1 hypothetical protein DFP89_11110 [Paracoccus lutimaris]